MSVVSPIPLKIKKSNSKLIGWIVLSGIFVAGGVWMIQGGAVDRRGEYSIFVGWIATVFFGLGGVSFLYRLFFGPQVPLELSQDGFIYRRVFTSKVAWRHVSKMSVRRDKRTSLIQIQLQPDAIEHLEFVQSSRAIRAITGRSSPCQVAIMSSDLEISFPVLRTLFTRYLQQYNPSADIE